MIFGACFRLGLFALDTAIETMIEGSFWNLTFLSEDSRRKKAARSKTRMSRISRNFSSNFYRSDFSIVTYSQIRKLGLQKIRVSLFSIFAYSQIQKLGSEKSEISKHPAFMIFVNIQIQKSFLK